MPLVRMIVNRLGTSILLLFVASALTFVLLSLVPGDAAQVIIGQYGTQDQYELVRSQLGLDRALPVQYWMWLEQVLHGNLGASLFSQESVTTLLNQRLPVSLSLVIAGTLVSGIVGVGLGLWSARRGGFLLKLVDGAAIVGLAVPSFWLALVLVAIFGVAVRWFPVVGYTPLTESPIEWAHGLVLPIVALMIGTVAMIAKQTRDSVLDTLNRDFIRVMEANGIPQGSIVYRHVLRNASVPVVTVLGLVLVHMLAGAIFIETIFAMPGVASLIMQATLQHDVPVIQGCVIYVTVFVVIVNLAVDLIYGLLDPRVRVR